MAKGIGKGTYGFYKGAQKHGTPVQSIGQDLDDKLNKRRALDLEEERLRRQKEKDKGKQANMEELDPTNLPTFIVNDASQYLSQGEKILGNIFESDMSDSDKRSQEYAVKNLNIKYETFGSTYNATIKQIDESNLTPIEKTDAIHKLDKFKYGKYDTNIVKNKHGIYDLEYSTTVEGEDGNNYISEISFPDSMDEMLKVQGEVRNSDAQNTAYTKVKDGLTYHAVTSDKGYYIEKFAGRTKENLEQAMKDAGVADYTGQAQRLYNEFREEAILKEVPREPEADKVKDPVSPYRATELVITKNEGSGKHDDSVNLTTLDDKTGRIVETLYDKDNVERNGYFKTARYKNGKVYEVDMFVPENIDLINSKADKIMSSGATDIDKSSALTELMKTAAGQVMTIQMDSGNADIDDKNLTTVNQQLQFVTKEYNKQRLATLTADANNPQ